MTKNTLTALADHQKVIVEREKALHAALARRRTLIDRAIADGRRKADIARALGISPSRVEQILDGETRR